MKAKKEKGKMKKIIMAIGMVCVSVIPATAEITIVNGGFSGGGVEATLPAGVQGYWSFDDGTAADSSSNANHGVITGAVAVPGIAEGALILKPMISMTMYVFLIPQPWRISRKEATPCRFG